MKATGVHSVVVRTARTCRARNRVQRVSGGSNGQEKASTGMLAWVGGSLVATILSLLLLTPPLTASMVVPVMDVGKVRVTMPQLDVHVPV